MKTINLKHDRPSVEAALSRLSDELRRARRDGQLTIKLVHGYGSHGVGGDIRAALQATLARMAQSGEIRDFIAGEEWRISNEHTWALLKSLPELKKDPDLGRENRGITIVVM